MPHLRASVAALLLGTSLLQAASAAPQLARALPGAVAAGSGLAAWPSGLDGSLARLALAAPARTPPDAVRSRPADDAAQTLSPAHAVPPFATFLLDVFAGAALPSRAASR